MSANRPCIKRSTPLASSPSRILAVPHFSFPDFISRATITADESMKIILEREREGGRGKRGTRENKRLKIKTKLSFSSSCYFPTRRPSPSTLSGSEEADLERRREGESSSRSMLDPRCLYIIIISSDSLFRDLVVVVVGANR